MNKLSTTKSLLAKLLATENVTVEHGKFSTASFDVKNRVLRLPIWKEMSGSLYDLWFFMKLGMHSGLQRKDGMNRLLRRVLALNLF